MKGLRILAKPVCCTPELQSIAVWESPDNPLSRQRKHLYEMLDQACGAVAHILGPGATYVKS
jgi:hypothetical protein